ncbi:hypothetical protein Tco_0501714 [Tanacetum coccineum]
MEKSLLYHHMGLLESFQVVSSEKGPMLISLGATLQNLESLFVIPIFNPLTAQVCDGSLRSSVGTSLKTHALRWDGGLTHALSVLIANRIVKCSRVISVLSISRSSCFQYPQLHFEAGKSIQGFGSQGVIVISHWKKGLGEARPRLWTCEKIGVANGNIRQDGAGIYLRQFLSFYDPIVINKGRRITHKKTESQCKKGAKTRPLGWGKSLWGRRSPIPKSSPQSLKFTHTLDDVGSDGHLVVVEVVVEEFVVVVACMWLWVRGWQWPILNIGRFRSGTGTITGASFGGEGKKVDVVLLISDPFSIDFSFAIETTSCRKSLTGLSYVVYLFYQPFSFSYPVHRGMPVAYHVFSEPFHPYAQVVVDTRGISVK